MIYPGGYTFVLLAILSIRYVRSTFTHEHEGFDRSIIAIAHNFKSTTFTSLYVYSTSHRIDFHSSAITYSRETSVIRIHVEPSREVSIRYFCHDKLSSSKHRLLKV